MPFGPAGSDTVTVPIDGEPPGMDVGFSDREVVCTGFTVTETNFDAPCRVAVIVGLYSTGFCTLLAENDPELLPAAIVTEPGTVMADALDVASVTVSPPEGATPFRSTFPFTTVAEPPTNVLGVMSTDASTAGTTLTEQVLAVAPNTAVTVTLVGVVTADVDAVKLAVLEPAGTVTKGGTARLALLENRLTASPPAGALADRVTVALVDESPPYIEMGAMATLVSVGAYSLLDDPTRPKTEAVQTSAVAKRMHRKIMGI